MVDFSDVVDSGYCFSNSINLRIDMEVGVTLKDNNEVIFRMEKHFSHRRRRILLDASSKSICIMHKKKVTGHGQWEVYKGDDRSQLSFIVKKPSMFRSEKNIDLDVFLPNNTKESVCKVKASCTRNSCEIYTAQSTLAKANAIMGNKDGMKVEIKASIDLAFIVALLMIVDEKKINKIVSSKPTTAEVMSGANDIVQIGFEVAAVLAKDGDDEDDQEKEQADADADVDADDGAGEEDF